MGDGFEPEPGLKAAGGPSGAQERRKLDAELGSFVSEASEEGGAPREAKGARRLGLRGHPTSTVPTNRPNRPARSPDPTSTAV